MAKKTSNTTEPDGGEVSTGTSTTAQNMMHAAEDTLGNFAHDLGKLLGSAQAKASSWLDQRKSIAVQLEQIRDTANTYLQQLTNTTPAPVRRGRPAGSGKRKASPVPPSVTKGTRKGKRKGGMSEEGRARVAAAQRARWAKIRASRNADR